MGWRRWLVRSPDVDDNKVKTTLAIYNACNHMGLDFEGMLQTIAMYADRNSLVHMSVLWMVRKGMWYKLTGLLHSGLRDLPVVTPEHLRENIPILQLIIKSVIDEYYNRNAEHPHDLNCWVPKEASFVKSAQWKKDKMARLGAVVKERERVEKQAIEKFEDMVSNHSYVQLAAASLGIEGPTGALPPGVPPKCLLSEDERREHRETFKRQKRYWESLVSKQKECHRKLKKYRDEYGTVESPIDPRFWMDVMSEDGERRGDDEEAVGSESAVS